MTYDVIIIGAGAAGLIAAYELSASGKKILALEANNRIGGRCHTIHEPGFSIPVETGAEFVHGDLPVTLSLLKKMGIPYYEMQGESYSVKKGRLRKEDDFNDNWGEMLHKLSKLSNDMSLTEFLTTYFEDEKYNELKISVMQFAQGFDAADPNKVSALSLQKEWTNDYDEHQYRIEGGYIKLMQWLADESIQNKTELKLSHRVTTIDHLNNSVTVFCENGEVFEAGKVLITIPLGVWKSGNNSIEFTPALKEKQEAALQMGFGNVIKINIEFTDSFWENNGRQSMPGAGFIFSDAMIPTWWTQNPQKTPQLTGWIAGPPADTLNNLDEDELRHKVLESLAYIFKIEEATIRTKITRSIITNWHHEMYACGGYSYETMQSSAARKVMLKPVNNKLFFAGEALYGGSHTGTVEAAFVSGKKAVEQMI